MSKLSSLVVLVLLSSCMGAHDSDAQKAEVADEETPAEVISGDTLKIDTTKSVTFWKGTKMRGAGMHSGEIYLKKGHFLMENGEISGGEFLTDMNTIKVTDIPPTDPIPIKNLTNHLKDGDFFDVDRYPISRFRILEVKRLSGDSLEVSGNLTIKDITRKITFDASSREESFNATFLIDRFQWNVAYKGSWKDRTFVDKEMELRVKLVWD